MILIGIGLYFLLFNDHINLILNGDKDLIIEVNHNYQDLGITLFNNKKEVPSNKYTININNNLNTNIIGKYQIDYQVKYKNKEYNTIRNITIVDTTKPIIEVNLEEIEKDYCTQKLSSNFKYSANDNYDGDLTDKIDSFEENNNLILKVEDSSHNETIKTIKINYKTKPSYKFTFWK